MPRIGPTARPSTQSQPSTNGVHRDDADKPEDGSPLKVFTFHGLDLAEPNGSRQAIGRCPFCEGEGKFAVNVETGQWDCKVCGTSGNVYGFLRTLWERSWQSTTDADAVEFAAERGLLSVGTLREWGACRSIVTGEWLVPGYSPDRKLNNVYVYRHVGVGARRKRRLLSTPTVHHQLFGAQLLDPRKPVVYLCEGPWDAMALWEALKATKATDSGYALTGSEAGSLAATSAVLAVPGVTTFPESWAGLLDRKTVAILYDSDHPRTLENGTRVDPPGYVGTRRVVKVLSRSESRPESVLWLAWGVDGFDPNLPDGTDVRDLLRSGGAETARDRVPNLTALMERVVPIPDEWTAGEGGGRSDGTGSGGGRVEIPPLPCEDWKTLSNSWRRALKWSEGLDRALSVMLAALASTNSIGDQVWVKVVGPPACGKSTLCEALSANLRHVVAKSTIRGFHSGYQTDADGKEDHSLISRLNGKTLITKDGDTLLQAENLGQILAEGRDVYDRVSRTSYRNKASRDYVGVSMTWILCGTSSLRALDSSELGQRFLDCVIMDRIENEEERAIVMQALHRQSRARGVSVSETTTLADEDQTRAIRLTSGYVDYLGKWGNSLLQGLEETDEQLERIADLALFVAYLRARPSLHQKEEVFRELSTRLSIQLLRLAECLAIVLNRPTLDAEVMRRVTRCAMDTARGRTLEIVRVLAERGEGGVEAKTLSILTAQTESEERDLLKFLKKLGAVEVFVPTVAGVRAQPRWRLTPVLSDLYGRLTGAAEPAGAD